MRSSAAVHAIRIAISPVRDEEAFREHDARH
jgi:hypothetical protein